MKFLASDPFIKQRRTDQGWTVEFEIDETQYDIIKELPKYRGIPLTVEVTSGTE